MRKIQLKKEEALKDDIEKFTEFLNNDEEPLNISDISDHKDEQFNVLITDIQLKHAARTKENILDELLKDSTFPIDGKKVIIQKFLKDEKFPKVMELINSGDDADKSLIDDYKQLLFKAYLGKNMLSDAKKLLDENIGLSKPRLFEAYLKNNMLSDAKAILDHTHHTSVIKLFNKCLEKGNTSISQELIEQFKDDENVIVSFMDAYLEKKNDLSLDNEFLKLDTQNSDIVARQFCIKVRNKDQYTEVELNEDFNKLSDVSIKSIINSDIFDAIYKDSLQFIDFKNKVLSINDNAVALKLFEVALSYDHDTVNSVLENANYDLTKQCYDLIITKGGSAQNLVTIINKLLKDGKVEDFYVDNIIKKEGVEKNNFVAMKIMLDNIPDKIVENLKIDPQLDKDNSPLKVRKEEINFQAEIRDSVDYNWYDKILRPIYKIFDWEYKPEAENFAKYVVLSYVQPKYRAGEVADISNSVMELKEQCKDKESELKNLYQTNKEKFKDSDSLLKKDEEYKDILAIILPEDLSFLKSTDAQAMSSQPLKTHSDHAPYIETHKQVYDHPQSLDKHHHHAEDLHKEKSNIKAPTNSRG